MNNYIRIIGGNFRGKKITFLPAVGLRPTPDRVKETVFNWLMHDVLNARCLDAFAGSGSLGLEAFSRGAKEVLFLESAKPVYQQLKKITANFNNNNLQVMHKNALEFLSVQQNPFDIIFLDPPFQEKILLPALELIGQNNILSASGFVYVESAEPLRLDENKWQQVKLKKAGQVYYGLYKKPFTGI